MLTDQNKRTISDCLSQISKTLPGFQARASQRKMIAEVAKTFSRMSSIKQTNNELALENQTGESILVIEGPTGTGKSLAYLLPSIVLAKSLSKRLVVTSATVALQEQLANKDIPFLTKHAGLNVSYAIAKGRGRYACTHKLQHLLGNETGTIEQNFQQTDLFNNFNSPSGLAPNAVMTEKMQHLLNLLMSKKWCGDRDALTESVPDELWSQITNDRHGCIKKLCPYFTQCPFFTARNRLDDVDVIIANHDLLLSDAAMGGGVILPDPSETFYCIDEAHHLADKAIKQFAAYHSLNGTLRFLERMKLNLNRALLIIKEQQQATKFEELIGSIETSLNELHIIIADIPNFIPYQNKNISYQAKTFRFAHGLLPNALLSLGANLAVATRSLHKHLNVLIENVRKKLNESFSTQTTAFEKVLNELGFYNGRVENFANVWQLMTKTISSNEPPIAKWITAEFTSKNTDIEYTLYASPIRADNILSEYLWNKIGGAVLTSATLRSLGSFDMLLNMTGLKNFPATTCVALDSPFNFQNQAKLIVPAMKSDPKDALKHTEEIIQLLPTLIQSKDGNGTLVLFASKKQMLEVASALPNTLIQLLLIQGKEAKEILLHKHFSRINKNLPSILFGLASFAEGLDLPGNACNHVIIAKLPFATPDDPLGETLSEWIEKNGRNAFFEITLPNASIKLIQAVGRLIRSEQDRGVVTILDTRLKTKPYGKLLLKDLPPFRLNI